MNKIKTAMTKAALSGLYHSGAHRLLAPYTQGAGVIFLLHQVLPESAEPQPFAPNRGLVSTPDFLDAMLDQVESAGMDVVSLDEVVRRLREKDERRFACFTFDDAYRDNLEYAYPIFKRRSLPMMLYVPSDYPDGNGDLWWLALEQVVARTPDAIELNRDGTLWRLPTATVAEKYRAFRQVYWWLRAVDEGTQRQVVRELADRYGVDMAADCRKLIMSWDEIRSLAADPLVTIGAHTKAHFNVAKLSRAQARDELMGGADKIARELGKRPVHFAYPYGGADAAGKREFALARECGFETGVTTQKGMLFPAHEAHLTALPRVSVGGDYQSRAFTEVCLTGAPFALWNGFRQVNAA